MHARSGVYRSIHFTYFEELRVGLMVQPQDVSVSEVVGVTAHLHAAGLDRDPSGWSLVDGEFETMPLIPLEGDCGCAAHTPCRARSLLTGVSTHEILDNVERCSEADGRVRDGRSWDAKSSTFAYPSVVLAGINLH